MEGDGADINGDMKRTNINGDMKRKITVCGSGWQDHLLPQTLSLKAPKKGARGNIL